MEPFSRATRRLARDDGPNSLAGGFRAARFKVFERILADLPTPTRILDLGGTNDFWEVRGLADNSSVSITIANIFEQEKLFANITPVTASVTDFNDHADDSFDLVFSNSTIEHLFTWKAQRAMADEIRRLAPAYFVQTPNYWFPVEPHFLTLGWHWLPSSARIALIRRRRFGHRGPCPTEDEARRAVDEVRLLRSAEMKDLFPDGHLYRERIGPITKSLTAIRSPAYGTPAWQHEEPDRPAQAERR